MCIEERELTVFISSLHIKEFRGIRECKSPLSLSKFTVLLGRNNSGKSAVLEALSLFPNFKVSKLYLNQLSSIEFLKNLHAGYSSLIYGYSGIAELNCTLKGEKLKITLEDNNQFSLLADDKVPFLDKGQRFEKREFTEPAQALKRIANSIDGDRDDNWKLGNSTFFIPNDTSFMDGLQTGMKDDYVWNLITKTGANSKVIQLVNKCVDDKYSEVLRTPELSARKERGSEKLPFYVKIKDLGEGIQKVVTTALWLEALNPQLILWDDFEGSAHPSLINVLVEWIAKKPWQVILSTHSFDVLNSILNVRPEGTEVIQLKKTDNDALIQNSLTLQELEDIVDSSQDPRKMVDLLDL